MTNKRNSRGFTLVELLIVIVVIAILAAISVVAYNGVQNRAKKAAGQETASTIQKKFEALNAIKGSYLVSTGGAATTGANLNTTAGTSAPEAVLDKASAMIAATAFNDGSTLTASTAANGTVVSAWSCAGGANIWYWDYTAASGSELTQIKAGAGCAS